MCWKCYNRNISNLERVEGAVGIDSCRLVILKFGKQQ